MDLRYVLERAPGVSRRFVYYLESQGYIQPTRVQKERIARRDYSEEDLRVIRETWKYYRRGFALQAAYELGVKQEHITCYLFFQAPPNRRREVLHRLRELPELIEASVVYADTADFIVKSSTPQEADIYHAMVPLFAETGITGVPEVIHVILSFSREANPSSNGEKPHMMAYVLMRVPSKNVAEVLATLKSFPEVVELSTVYGESDVIARVVTADQLELDSLVMERIHGIPAVETTRTYIVVSNMYWSRERDHVGDRRQPVES